MIYCTGHPESMCRQQDTHKWLCMYHLRMPNGLQSDLQPPQALRADAEAKAGMLRRAAEAQQCAQAEAERAQQAYAHERDLARALQEESTSWKSRAGAREEVCLSKSC